MKVYIAAEDRNTSHRKPEAKCSGNLMQISSLLQVGNGVQLLWEYVWYFPRIIRWTNGPAQIVFGVVAYAMEIVMYFNQEALRLQSVNYVCSCAGLVPFASSAGNKYAEGCDMHGLMSQLPRAGRRTRKKTALQTKKKCTISYLIYHLTGSWNMVMKDRGGRATTKNRDS